MRKKWLGGDDNSDIPSLLASLDAERARFTRLEAAFHHVANCVECVETSYAHCPEGSELVAAALPPVPKGEGE
jgi:hypothetical protein